MEPIRGTTVTLRPARESDLDPLSDWFADSAIYEWWGGSPVLRDVVAEKYTGRRRPAVESLIIEAEGRPVGYIQYHQRFEEYHDADEGGVDMFVEPDARRRGFGRDAAVTLVRHLLDERGWSRVRVDPSKNNPTALRFWRECGFQYERDIESDGPAELLSVVRAVEISASPDGEPAHRRAQATSANTRAAQSCVSGRQATSPTLGGATGGRGSRVCHAVCLSDSGQFQCDSTIAAPI